MVTKDKQWWKFKVLLRLSNTHNGYKTSKYAANYVHPCAQPYVHPYTHPYMHPYVHPYT